MNEPLLARLWLSGGWPRSATLDAEGRAFAIVYPGRAGHGPGPDLRGAILSRDDGSLLTGDVEFHVRASDWMRHGHARDPRYSRVIAHVIWRNDLPGPIARAPDPAVPLLTFELSGIEPAILFHRLALPAPPCAPTHEWLRRQPADERVAFLDRLGDERLAEKSLRFGADLHAVGAEQTLHAGVCDALGYSQNRQPMRRLAEEMPDVVARSILAAAVDAEAAERALFEALCLAGGLGHSLDGGHPGAAQGAWDLAASRPANRPERRLAGLARLLARDRHTSLLDRLITSFGGESRLAARRLEAVFRVDRPSDHPIVTVGTDSPRSIDYWLGHAAPNRPMPGGTMALIGASRARAIVANVALPVLLAVADQRGDDALAAAIWAIWPSVGAPGPNWILEEMRDVTEGIHVGSARREQGVIALFRRCCSERRCDLAPRCEARRTG